MNRVLFTISLDEDDVVLNLDSDEMEEETVLEGKKKEIISEFQTIYDILEANDKAKEKKLKESVSTLSKLFLSDFSDKLRDYDHICFVIGYEFVKCAFDLLEIDGKPLFLTHIIHYIMDEGEPETKPEIKLGSSLIVCDLTCDPEKAGEEVKKLFQESEYFKMEDTSVNEILEKSEDLDVLIVSAHGDIEDETSGSVGINEEYLTSDEMEKVSASLVYFDSCQQGINTDFLEVFQEECNVTYYTAPIISNDAGDSSTKTMTWFFEDLKKTGNPVNALFETRKKLYKTYKDKGLSHVVILSKAFPFRLYEFPEE